MYVRSKVGMMVDRCYWVQWRPLEACLSDRVAISTETLAKATSHDLSVII